MLLPMFQPNTVATTHLCQIFQKHSLHLGTGQLGRATHQQNLQWLPFGQGHGRGEINTTQIKVILEHALPKTFTVQTDNKKTARYM
jgi:hypothetical protein